MTSGKITILYGLSGWKCGLTAQGSGAGITIRVTEQDLRAGLSKLTLTSLPEQRVSSGGPADMALSSHSVVCL